MNKNAEIIYKIIINSADHPTAEDIYLEFKKNHGKVALATIYNNLITLCSEGLIRKIIMDGEPDRYDKTVRHDHLICQKCGAISDFYMDDITEMLEKKLGDKIISYDLRCEYICPKCRKAEV